MGAGWAFMGRQDHIEVSGDDYYNWHIDVQYLPTPLFGDRVNQ